MNSRTIDVVTGWETVATPAGYQGLHQLADAEFSGAVSAGTTWAFLLNGRVVGVFEGRIEDFEDADVTAYRAVDPSLPLLFTMQERGSGAQARYYTNETPLEDVDRTLSNGGFTGYVELSENVLSGDYYVVYHGGKSMSAAFVGNSERLVTGEEAFETAADEVGIYEVIDIDIELVDIPEPAGDEGDDGRGRDGTVAGAGGAAADADGNGAHGPTGADADGDGPDGRTAATEPADPTPDPTPDLDPVGSLTDSVGAPNQGTAAGGADAGVDPASAGAGAGADGGSPPAPDTEVVDEPGLGAVEDGEGITPVGDNPGAEPDAPEDGAVETDVARTEETGDGEAADGAADAGAEAEGDAESHAPLDVGPAGGAEAAAEPESGPGPDPSPAEPRTEDAADGRGEDPSEPNATAAGAPASERVDAEPGPAGAAAEERRWQEAQTIPSLDPDASRDGGDGDQRAAARERAERIQQRRSERDRAAGGSQRPAALGASDESASPERLRRRLSRARDRIEELEAERDDLREERERLVEERNSLRGERSERAERIEELEAECERLRSEVDRLESELDGGGAAAGGQTMSPDRALSGTNLFVRYDSKGQATLEHAHDGEASREAVRKNLRLGHHTTFETEDVVVDGQPYEAFLRDSTEYAFARWVVSDLLYEIGGTGNRSALAGVFDAIPEIDRIELHGEVGVETDDGVERRAFDVICRGRMGDPLFVADINPSRDTTTEAMVGSLVENTDTVATAEESLAAGFYVTESFYEPAALETVSEQTGGGLLSRSKKRSFVKLSRKRGYHLCLVEARDGEFHLNVPEL